MSPVLVHPRIGPQPRSSTTGTHSLQSLGTCLRSGTRVYGHSASPHPRGHTIIRAATMKQRGIPVNRTIVIIGAMITIRLINQINTGIDHDTLQITIVSLGTKANSMHRKLPSKKSP